MTVIETMTFRLADRVDEAAFVRADERLQSEFASRQPGLVRRTTARGIGARSGEWVVIDEWRDVGDADAGAAQWEVDESIAASSVAAFLALVDPATVDVRRYVVG